MVKSISICAKALVCSINLYSRSNIFFSNLLNALRNLIVPNDRLQTQMIPSVITLKKMHNSIDFIIFIERP